ncbi:hypothetical protein HPB52_005970 [Rhipicephalus sanguineus]|uniref:Uncharacterized protein n=1 Tax=Rhipicephalus sanguineus TaxID=34632 RepID=A0A9D4SZJ7_RHISA|nr:hypothetical protein HPB52_005970 [Rhipicephalus sanguineus]
MYVTVDGCYVGQSGRWAEQARVVPAAAMPLFGKSQKSPYELVKVLREAVLALERGDKKAEKAQEDVSKHLVMMKNMLYGTCDTEPQTDIVVAQLAQELYNTNLLLLLVQNLSKIDFETVMERAKNKRASRRSQSTRIVNEVNQLVQSDQFELSTHHVLHSRLKAVQTELAALNAELETFLTDEQVAEDYDSVMEYEDAATSALALLEHHMNRLKVSSPASTAHTPATTTGEDPPATST